VLDDDIRGCWMLRSMLYKVAKNWMNDRVAIEAFTEQGDGFRRDVNADNRCGICVKQCDDIVTGSATGHDHLGIDGNVAKKFD
jgi:hypothetical protein